MFDYDVYALCGDGCMMEGISSEAASLAGHLRLANLCWIYDRNKVTIEGHTDLAFTEDVATRFLGYDWNVTRVSDANDQAAIERALTSFKRSTDRPTLIVVESHIGYGAPHKEDTSAAHGEPLGDEEVRLTKRNYGWPENAQFLVPDGVREHFQAGMGQRGHALRDAWMAKFVDYQRQYPELADQLTRMQRRELPDGWDQDLPVFPADAKGIASRDSSGQVLNALAQRVPWLIGGAADLSPSTKTRLTFPAAGDFQARQAGRAELPLRHPRARHGRDHQRPLPVQGPSLRLRLPDLQRLRAGLAAPGRDHGDPGHLRVHPRFDRRRRGRADSSARRAPRLAPRHSRPHHHETRGRQRGDRGLARDHAVPPRARWP